MTREKPTSARPILVLKAGETLPDVKAVFGDFELWIAQGLERSVDELLVVEVYAGAELPDVSQVAGVVVTGSPAMVTDLADWSEASARWLAEVVHADAAPVLGICYGHQLLAHALGGRVASNPNGREMGTFEVRFPGGKGNLAPLFEAGSIPAHFSHLESVVEIPADAKVLASTALEPHCALAFGPRQWGVQFHPEFDVPIMRAYLEARRSNLVDEGLDPDTSIEAVVPTPGSSRTLARFAALVDAAGSDRG